MMYVCRMYIIYIYGRVHGVYIRSMIRAEVCCKFNIETTIMRRNNDIRNNNWCRTEHNNNITTISCVQTDRRDHILILYIYNNAHATR